MPEALAAICCGGRVKPGPGRPRDPAKQDAIVNAARAAFFERGFSASTIEDIAARAGVSKVTLYNRFGDKETLFEAVIRSEISRMTAAFDLCGEEAHTLEERLNLFGEGLLTSLFDGHHVNFDRVLGPEIAQIPALAERFFRAGPALCRGRLAELLIDAHAAGTIAVDDPLAAAEDLVSLWKGFGDIELKFGLVEQPGPDMIRERAARGTRTFLRAYGRAPVPQEGEKA